VAEAWSQLLAEWVSPEIALDGWQERIARVARQECAYLASLPYVKGVAVIGSVGRGTPWPISDVDLLVVAERHAGQDPESLIRAVETQRNARLAAAGIPNDVEAGNWVLLASDVAAAVEADRTAFLQMVDHPHWTGIVVKSSGARVTHDFDGRVRAFLGRCQSILWKEDFVRLWLGRSVENVRRGLADARDLLRRNEAESASQRLPLAAQEASWGLYAAWRALPQSISRGVTRLMRQAAAMADEAAGEAFLRAARLEEADVWERVAALPERGERERRTWLEVRKGCEEGITELSAARDFLQLHAYLSLRSTAGPHALWTGVTGHVRAVEAQLEAVELLLRCLENQSHWRNV
jgi:predicted nucleotidyltransferase